MKKFALSVTALLVAGALSAQLENLRLGIQLSPTVSWINADDDFINTTSSRIGLKTGIAGEYFLTENIGFTSGISVAFGQGATLKHEYGGNLLPNSELSDDQLNSGDKPLPDGVRISYGLHYIEVPFGIKFRTNEKGYLRYYAELPILTLGVNTRARSDIEGQEIDARGENISDDVALFNMQLGLGGGIEYSLSPGTSLVAGLYFNTGLNDITKNDGTRAIDNPDQAPSNPNDDYIFEAEDSRARLGNITLRVAIMF